MGKKIIRIIGVIVCSMSLCLGTKVFAKGITVDLAEGVSIDNLVDTYNLETGEMTTDILQNDLATNSDGFIGTGPVEKEMPSTRSIIGKDERVKVTSYTAAPYRYIGLVKGTNENGFSSKGTGFLVSPTLVLTSARYVYDVTEGELASSVYFTAGASKGSDGYGHFKAKAIHIPTAYKNSIKGDENYRKYDYALIELNFPVGNTTGYFGYRSNAVVFPYSVTVNITGYDTDNNLYKGTGKGTMQSNNLYLNYSIDTVAKTAGAPIYKSDNGQFYAIGLHIGAGNDFNFGRIITDRIATAINKYK